MILYNTIVGLAAGVGLLLVGQLLKQLANGEKVQPEGFALGFGMTGFILTVLGLTISVMWPYNKLLHANNHDARAGVGLWGLARRCLILFVAQAQTT
jgi:hypothetical protein